MKLCGFEIGVDKPFFLIAGPCVIESPEHCRLMVAEIKTITSRCGVPFIFKASFDKANRSSIDSFRGPGIEEAVGLFCPEVGFS